MFFGISCQQRQSRDTGLGEHLVYPRATVPCAETSAVCCLCWSGLESVFEMGVRAEYGKPNAGFLAYVDPMLLLQFKKLITFSFYPCVSNSILIFFCNSGPSAMV